MPLWRISLHVLFFAFAVQRGLTAFTLHSQDGDPRLVAITALQAVVGMWASFFLFAGRFMAGAVILTAASVVAGALIALALSNGAGAPWVFGQIFAAVCGAAGLAYFLRQERKHPGRWR